MYINNSRDTTTGHKTNHNSLHSTNHAVPRKLLWLVVVSLELLYLYIVCCMISMHFLNQNVAPAYSLLCNLIIQ